MPRVCTVCASPDRAAIDKALVAGEPVRSVASRYGTLGRMAVQRHKEEHLPTALVAAAGEEAVKQALDVVQQLKAINGASMAILVEARRAQDGELALKAVDRIQRQIELQAKLLGELDERPQVNVLVMPEWLALRARVLAALAAFPEARIAVAEALNHAGE